MDFVIHLVERLSDMSDRQWLPELTTEYLKLFSLYRYEICEVLLII